MAMIDFLDNPEERISSFGSSVQNLVNKPDKSVKQPVDYSTRYKKRKNDTPSLQRKDQKKNLTEGTVQIRISISIEQKIRDLLLCHYKNTGEKVSVREYVDTALRYYIESVERKC